MRVRWVLVLLALLLIAAPAASVPTVDEVRGGADPRVPDDVYNDSTPRPVVEFPNATLEKNGTYQLDIKVSIAAGLDRYNNTVEVRLEIYQHAVFEKEEALDEITGPPPMFIIDVPGTNNTTESLIHHVKLDVNDDVVVDVPNQVAVPKDTRAGFYRVRVLLEWAISNTTMKNAKSWGYYTPASWRSTIDGIMEEDDPTKVEYIVSEGGFNVVLKDYKEVSLPNKVPDFGDFSTPVIRPGETGEYGFTVTNRYDRPMVNVMLTIEFYMWATIEDSKPIKRIQGTAPKIVGEGSPGTTVDLGDIPVGGSEDIEIEITTSDDTDKGTYFVRHSIVFTYGDEPNASRFRMDSRGYFTFEQWEGFDYTNLHYQLNGTAGIVPDSSFSVKDPVPLWPLATLITLCVLFGALAVVFYLAEEHGDQYPRLKRGLQAVTGRWEQRKALMRQRLDELRQEDWETREPGEAEGEAEP
jgi:hypothetical protein